MDENVPTSAGLSSYNLLDEKAFFEALRLRPGMTVLDLACGVGNYSVAAVPHLGGTGRILAMDLWAEGIETLQVRADMLKAEAILPLIGNAAAGLPVRNRSIDCCLMATIVHILSQENALLPVLDEIRRILRPAGILAVVEFHKIEGPPGPPPAWRLSPGELNNLFSSRRFHCMLHRDIGPYNYLSIFGADS